jgi:spoIIIJ-associated protein
MEWVETTGRTVEKAIDAALDELGVDEDEAEIEILVEARTGILGRRDARIRARVKPLSREKPQDRRRRPSRARGARPAARGRARGASSGDGAVAVAEDPAEPRARSGGRRRRGGRGRRRGGGEGQQTQREDDAVSEHDEVPVEEQAAAAAAFTRGLVEAFAADAEVVTTIDDDAVLVEVSGRDLGLLVGQKGATLQAIEELVRTVVQRQTEGHGARINVDVAGYRAKRRAALEAFAQELAEQVRSSGKGQSLEPMSASDRKVVHDAVAEIAGVTTASEGEEPRRRVVISPSG